MMQLGVLFGPIRSPQAGPRDEDGAAKRFASELLISYGSVTTSEWPPELPTRPGMVLVLASTALPEHCGLQRRGHSWVSEADWMLYCWSQFFWSENIIVMRGPTLTSDPLDLLTPNFGLLHSFFQQHQQLMVCRLVWGICSRMHVLRAGSCSLATYRAEKISRQGFDSKKLYPTI